jgi:hypothetical protein
VFNVYLHVSLCNGWLPFVSEIGQPVDTLKEFRMAIAVGPDNARFAYVCAIALNDGGQCKDTVQILRRALKHAAYDRDVPSGLAYFTAKSGDRAPALGYAKQLRDLDPENPQYAQMEKQIGGAR